LLGSPAKLTFVKANLISFAFDCFTKAFFGITDGVPSDAGLLLGDIFA